MNKLNHTPWIYFIKKKFIKQKQNKKMISTLINRILGKQKPSQIKTKKMKAKTKKMKNTVSKQVMTKRFYKEKSGLWYIDLPEFLNAGLGNKNNLLMVAGADTFLDILSNNGKEVTIKFSSVPFRGQKDHLKKTGMGMDKALLDSIGHAPVDYGAYYKSTQADHILWLCPVAEYVFDGGYPDDIYIKVIK